MGPLHGTKVVEIAGIGPAPFCGMTLADLGAEVILIERKTPNPNASEVDKNMAPKAAFFKRGKKSVALDLKKPEAIEAVMRLLETADVLVEGFRPGVMERFGLGPDECLARNKRLVYGRQTGWGQTGPLARSAGHDINYIALAGALYYTGHAGEAPFTPPTVLGDVAGGAMILTIGILAALLHAKNTGEGQVVDAAITDGTVYMMTLLEAIRSAGLFGEPRGSTVFSGGAPWYQTYECADGEYISIGSLEPNFYRLLLEKLGLQEDPDLSRQYDSRNWASAAKKLSQVFKGRSRDQWCELLEGTDVCFAPVLTMPEAREHPHNKERQNFVTIDGHVQPAPAPKFSRSRASAGEVPMPGADTEETLAQLGYSDPEIEKMRQNGTI